MPPEYTETMHEKDFGGAWHGYAIAAFEASGMTQSELARRLDVNRAHVSNVVNKHSGMSAALFVRWLEECGWSCRPGAGLADEEVELLARLAVILPALDAGALGALRAQVAFWESKIG